MKATVWNINIENPNAFKTLIQAGVYVINTSFNKL